jgi:hypothetical protein
MNAKKREYSEKDIKLSYKGRCISDKEELKGGYCGSCPIEMHRDQLADPDSWVHSCFNSWLERATRIDPEQEIARLKAENEELVGALEILYAWSLADVNDTPSQKIVDAVETALAQAKGEPK